MAIMGRKKRAVALGWEAKNKQRDDYTKKQNEDFKEKHKDTPEERAEKEKILREAGLLR